MIKIFKKSNLMLNKSIWWYFANKILKIPSIAESVEEVTVFKYLIEEGQYANEDDKILEVESSKGNFEIWSPQSGKVVKYLVDLE